MSYNPVVVVGNGLSRKGQDLQRIPPEVPIVGCNSLWWDADPDVIVSIDEAQHQEQDREMPPHIETVRTVVGDGAARLRDGRVLFQTYPPYGWCSGRVAIHAAVELYSPSHIYLLGFDFGSTDGGPNNIYHTNPQPRSLDRFIQSLTDLSQQCIIRVGPPLDCTIPGLECLSYTNFWRRMDEH